MLGEGGAPVEPPEHVAQVRGGAGTQLRGVCGGVGAAEPIGGDLQFIQDAGTDVGGLCLSGELDQLQLGVQAVRT
jgi:hypothetical protein